MIDLTVIVSSALLFVLLSLVAPYITSALAEPCPGHAVLGTLSTGYYVCVYGEERSSATVLTTMTIGWIGIALPPPMRESRLLPEGLGC
jgi:hypothetical protein